MNSGSFALEPISQDQVLVIVALALVAVLALFTIAAMIWGARLKRRRKAAEEEELHRIEDLKASGVEATNTAEGTPAPTPAPTPADVSAANADHRPPAPARLPSDDHADEPGRPVIAPAPVSTPADDRGPLADEPIAAAAPLDASPASIAADAPATDDPGATPIGILKGLGPKIATRLGELGITRVDQLAWLDDAEAAELNGQLGAFEGRMERDRWREQARLLAQGDRAAYEAQFGKLG